MRACLIDITENQARRQRGGNVFLLDFFLAPHGIFLSWCFRVEKTLEFAILARKSLRISAKTFFFEDHLLLVGKFAISARKSLRISAKTFAPLLLILPPPRSREAGDAPAENVQYVLNNRC